jgi:aldose 1-epimerase
MIGFTREFSDINRTLEAGVKNGFTHLEIAEGAGAALSGLSGVAAGRSFNLLPEIDRDALAREATGNPNVLFQKFSSPLFPIANRLRGPGSAELLGQTVRFPLNNRAHAGAEAHHLHGTLFRRPSDLVRVLRDYDRTTSESIFRAGEHSDWAEAAEISIFHSLIGGKYRYELRATNRGSAPIPVGFGAHPYFRLPSGEAGTARLLIPADRVAEIDGHANVFPTGKWRATADTRFDFNSPRTMPGGPFDHFFHFSANGPRSVELRDEAARIGFRMSAASANILGAQFYYPGAGDVFALELVTHLPDPRAATWGDEPTGIRLLQSGETESYAFEIEVFTLA